MAEPAQIVGGDFCIGCGACAYAAGPQAVRMELDSYGKFQSRLLPSAAPAAVARAEAVCPFSDHGPDEDAIAAALYPELPAHPEIGRHGRTWAGWVESNGYRAGGSSGGLTSWIAARLLEKGLVDAVVHVQPVEPDDNGGLMFRYAVSENVETLRQGAKSRYYPIEMSGVLQQIADSPGKRFAVVGVPCFIKAVRRTALQDPVIAERVAYTLALVCGHLKSRAFAELLAWQCGIAPDDLKAVDFRHKIAGRPASRYGFTALARDGHMVEKPMSELAGGDWGQGFFKYNACEYCDDVLGETADVAIGDAWLPQYVDDSQGTNVLVARHPEIIALLESGASTGAVHLEPITPDALAQSQRSGLNHRREGLAYRLARLRDRGKPAPKKRVEPSMAVPEQRRKIYDVRLRLLEDSHEAFLAARQAGRLNIFFTHMKPALAEYRALYRPPLPRRIIGRIRRILRAAGGRN